MRLDIQALFSGEQDKLPFTHGFPADGLVADIKEGTVSVVGTVVSHGGYVELGACVSVVAKAVCARCGKEFPWSYDFTVNRPVAKKLVSEDDDYILAEDGFVDIAELFREEALLELPAKLVCKKSCLGLCQHCGKDLNEGKCFCTGKEIDPRLAVLKTLLD